MSTEDLNKLCLSCKALKSIVLPKLYESIELAVSHHSSEFSALESLLGSPGEGLQYTKSIVIGTKQGCSKTKPKDGDNEPARSQDAQTDSLNTLIRSLIMRVPTNKIEKFL